MWETSARLLKLLSLLQARRDWSGTELAVRLEVSERTVRRDVERLRDLGCPSIIPPAPGYHPARVGGSWLLRTLLPSGLRAVVVPSGFSVTVQPSWWMQIW
jgi:biotin operon repressor